MEIKILQKKDYSKAINFAIKGMHFEQYMDSPFLLKLYGRYFFYMEMNRASHILAAYDGDTLCGLLLAEIYGKPLCHRVKTELWYVAIFKKLQKLYTSGADVYDQTNRLIYRKYRHSHIPDGELIFLAADPNNAQKGVGSLLLAELERREPGKEIFLYTDSNCTYQFYEHRGFERIAQQEVTIELPDGKVALSCFLYRKKLGGDEK